MSKIRAIIAQAFNKHPILFNSVLYGSLYLTAECSQQVISKKILPEEPKPFDKAAFAKFGFFGTCIQGPLLTVWYIWLDKNIPGKTIKICTKKLIMDQFLMTPVLYTLFYTVMSAIEGEEDIFKELRNKFVPTFKVSCCFWVPAQFANFLIIPPAFRVTYVGCCALIWVNILLYIKQQKF